VSPRVRYGMTCLLNRDAMGNWRSYSSRLTQCKRDRGTMTTPRNLTNAMALRTILAKLGIQPVVNLCNGM
jgi:hypothetical protein